ncbi:uncharacterized protein C8orf58 homolog [Tupaia chinensis]|uniref:uncharacterized protein C8orf58 homolog n=1 Tax=Tupaia chinensis TaxID=246437 RepID=UPI0007040AF8|nr:uncharacterized protein C8orf58 homolog [Tupaia chinensis]
MADQGRAFMFKEKIKVAQEAVLETDPAPLEDLRTRKKKGPFHASRGHLPTRVRAIPGRASLPCWPGTLLPAAVRNAGALGGVPRLTPTLLAGGVGADPDPDPDRGCVVPGVVSTYRRRSNSSSEGAPRGSAHSWTQDGELRGLGRAPLLTLASRDLGLERAVGESPLATLPGLSQDSLDFGPMRSHEPRAQRGRLPASHRSELVLEQSRPAPIHSACLAGPQRALEQSKPRCGVLPFGAEEQVSSEAATTLETGLEEEGAGGWGTRARACLPGQGLRYLEHLCLVLEQMARLQQLYLQLRTQRPPGDPRDGDLALALKPPLQAPGDRVHRSWELPSQAKETGAKATSLSKVQVPSTDDSRLAEAPEGPTLTFPSSQGHKRDLSHWAKVKMLLNRMCWRSPRYPEPPVPADGARPRTEPRDRPEKPQCRSHRKPFMPSLVVKQQRKTTLSLC